MEARHGDLFTRVITELKLNARCRRIAAAAPRREEVGMGGERWQVANSRPDERMKHEHASPTESSIC
jgi:hypothetical protein